MDLRLIAAGIAFFLFGCASTPEPRYYTLEAMAPVSTSVSELSVSVGPVTVPGVVDRPQIVLTASANRVSLDDFNRWAAPLQDNLSAVLAENLSGILGTPRVTVFPKDTGADAGYRVTVEVQRFESTPGMSAVIDATWVVRRATDGRVLVGRSSIRETVQDGTFEALVASHSRAAGRVSVDIADAIRVLSGQKSLAVDLTAQ